MMIDEQLRQRDFEEENTIVDKTQHLSRKELRALKRKQIPKSLKAKRY